MPIQIALLYHDKGSVSKGMIGVITTTVVMLFPQIFVDPWITKAIQGTTEKAVLVNTPPFGWRSSVGGGWFVGGSVGGSFV